VRSAKANAGFDAIATPAKFALNINLQTTILSPLWPILEQVISSGWICCRLKWKSPVVGALFGSKELGGHRITVESVAPTNVCATKRIASEIKALRVA
jgi:hypothetical protein